MSELRTVFWELDCIEHLSSTNSKKENLYKLLRVYPEAEEILRLTFNDSIYGVSDRSFERMLNYDKEKEGTYFDIGDLMARKIYDAGSSDYTINDVKEHLANIEKLKGNDKVGYLKQLMKFDRLYGKFVSRIVLKDLKIGISLITINNVLIKLGKQAIDKFEVQLCGSISSVEDDNDVFNKVGLPCLASIKYDGMRGFLTKKGDEVVFTSRNGKIIDYMPELTKHFEEEYPFDFIFDGEIMAKDFSELQKRIGRKEENLEPVEGLHFRLFDILKIKNIDFKDKLQSERTRYIEFNIDESEYLKVEEHKVCNSTLDVKNFFKMACERKEEGIILKNLNKPYEFDSRKNWWKVKPIIEGTFKIINWKKGTGKKASVLSSIQVTDLHHKVISWVGSGMTDNDILYIMNLEREGKLKETCVDIMFNEITVDKFGQKSLRHPRFLKIRHDKEQPDNIDART